MKHQKLLIALLLTGTLIMGACKKDDLSQSNVTNTKTESLKDYTDDYVCIQSGGDQFVFYEDAALLNYCEEHGAVDMYKTNQLLDSIYAKACELGIEDKDFDKVEDVPQEMKDYWVHIFGTDFGAMPNQPNAAKLTWGITLYNYENYGGSKKTCVGPTYWSLGDFNKKTTSFKVVSSGIGGIWFCHKKWYGKPRQGYFQFAIIGQFAWPYVGDANNNKYCSYCTTLH